MQQKVPTKLFASGLQSSSVHIGSVWNFARIAKTNFTNQRGLLGTGNSSGPYCIKVTAPAYLGLLLLGERWATAEPREGKGGAFLRQGDPTSLLHVVLRGARSAATGGAPRNVMLAIV